MKQWKSYFNPIKLKWSMQVFFSIRNSQGSSVYWRLKTPIINKKRIQLKHGWVVKVTISLKIHLMISLTFRNCRCWLFPNNRKLLLIGETSSSSYLELRRAALAIRSLNIYLELLLEMGEQLEINSTEYNW